MTKELFLNGELNLSRKETHGKSKQPKSVPVFTSRIEKHEYYRRVNAYDIRNVLDVKEFLKHIRANWNTYVSQVNLWIQKNPIKKIVVTGIFTVALGFFASASNAAVIEEYTYQVKNGENIENIAAQHGVTAQKILNANGLSSVDGKKILLPKVKDRMVTATVLNIRSEPNTHSSVIGKYKKGDVVKVVYVENGWAGILIKGRLCFVSADYLTHNQTVETTTSQTTETMYVTATSLNVREAATTRSAIIGSLKLNDTVYVTSFLNGWAKITFKGKTAFVSDTFLSKINKLKTKNTNTYVIKSGDTFTRIGKSLGISVSSILELNPGVDSTRLKIGQTIKVPSNARPAVNQIQITAQLGGVDPKGTFCFITSNGITYAAKASDNLINELFDHQGKKVTLTLEGNRGKLMKLVSLQ